MTKKVFLDVNIIVDLLDTTRKYHDDALRLINRLYDDGSEIVISEDMLSTIFYIVKDKKSTLKFFKVVQNQWVITPYGVEVVKDAIDLALIKGLDFEDVLQCLSAKNNQCDAIITHDNSFVDCGLKIYTARQFLTTSEVKNKK